MSAPVSRYGDDRRAVGFVVEYGISSKIPGGCRVARVWPVMKEILEVRRRLNDALDALQAQGTVAVGEPDAAPIAPPADVYETEHELVIVIELPGVRGEDIELQLHGDRLRVSGRGARAGDSADYVQIERLRGAFFRDFLVPSHRIEGSPSAVLEAGVLTVHLTKAPPPRPHKVPVTQQEGI